MKDELGGRIITEFVTLRPKTYSYLTDDFKDFDDYKKCLLNGEVVLKSQQRFKSKGHDVYTENINKIVLSSNDDNRLIAPDKITSYPYGYKGKNVLV